MTRMVDAQLKKLAKSSQLNVLTQSWRLVKTMHSLGLSAVHDERPQPGTNLASTKMGIHQWAYDSEVVDDDRQASAHLPVEQALSSMTIESELGFDAAAAFTEAERCLNCDVQTVFTESKCIECDGCTDICPTNCITFIDNDDEAALRTKLNAPTKTFACTVVYAQNVAQHQLGI